MLAHARALAELFGLAVLPPHRQLEPEVESEQRKVPSFDGGARMDQPTPAPTHGEAPTEILNSRAADVGAGWFQ